MTIKQSISKIMLIMLVMAGFACTSNYGLINTNPGDATPDDMNKDGYIVSSLLTTLQSNVLPVDPFASQFIDGLCGGPFGGYWADSGTWDYRISLYNATDDWMLPAFSDIIPKIFSNYAKLLVATDDPVITSVARVLRVAAMHRTTDIYGPIPFSQMGADGKLIAPYDNQKKVYEELFKELDNAIATLTVNRTNNFTPNADKVYGGNVDRWVKFANSLKLRMAMRLAYVEPALAQRMAEQAVVDAMTSNADNAFMSVAVNPYYTRLYDWNGGESRVSADIASYMNGYKDPRRAAYFTTTTSTVNDSFNGLRSGIANADINKSSQYYSNTLLKVASPLLWMNAAEVAFLKAEGALRGWAMGGSAESLYNRGIELSFEQQQVSGVDAYKADASSQPMAYIDPSGRTANNGPKQSTITIAWDGAAVDIEANLERIITQKWIAIFPLGHEAWAEYRRTGYPKLLPSPEASGMGIVKGGMPARLPYPQDEYRMNQANYLDALTMLGGSDNMATRLWWDVKPKN